MKGITPMLWYDTQAEEAAKFYVSVFPNSKVTGVTHYGDNMPMPKGTVMTASFSLDGQDYIALNGGPEFKHSEAVSFVVNCDTQEEIDRYWAKLSEGGQTNVCGWLKDKFGLSWQVTPAFIAEVMKKKDQRRIDNMMKALVQMTKLDLAALKRAYEEG
jgi:predicted 3-demethylubiquinone-9 3-methyltransferase (glyoxalase superfamily)